MTSAAIAGGTGLVGGHILSTLLALPSISSVHAYARKDLPENPKLHTLKSTDTSTWPGLFPKPAPQLFFSGLGTTRAAAGSTEKQYEIDYTLNLSLATAAKEAGCTTYVLISSGGANHNSNMFYMRMKGELEEAVKKLGFDHTVILRPGLIVGDRSDTRLAEGIFKVVALGLGKLHNGLRDSWSADADVIAKAAVRAGLDVVEGKREKGVWLVTNADIIRMGRTEWKN